MPVYLYEVVPTGEIIEIEHSIHDTPPTAHPETGQPLRRVYTAPNLSTHYTPGRTKQILSDASLEKSGFTKYVRDPLTRRYNRTVGSAGPSQLRPHG